MNAALRFVAPEELPLLEQIEAAADALFDGVLAAPLPPVAPAEERVASPGFVLVVVEDGLVVGFVHVLEVDGHAHLEQLSVLPEHGRRGHGRALVEAAVAEARRRGHDRMTLRTFADVPWNAPFYRSCGFVESEPSSDFLRGLVATERRLGLDRLGPRIQMTRALPDGRRGDSSANPGVEPA